MNKKVILVLLSAVVILCAIFNNYRTKSLWLFRKLPHLFPFSNSIKTTVLKTYLDLTEEFENKADNSAESFDVYEALERSGYQLTPVSAKAWRDDDRVIEKSDANKSASLSLKVPNVVHYVFLGSDLKFTLANYLSYRSVERFIKPKQIFVHGDNVPGGPWWNRTIEEVRNIYHVKRNSSITAPNGQKYKYPAHISDYWRTEILLRFGGIYLDADVMVVKSFKTLRQYTMVMGLQDDENLCNGIIIATRGAPFLRLLLEQYRSYKGPDEDWPEKSVVNSGKLSRLYPHLIHVEKKSLNRPSWAERGQIYDGKYNWSQNYAVHLWIRMWPEKSKPKRIEDLFNKRTTFGEISRLILFGSPEIRNYSTKATQTKSLKV